MTILTEIVSKKRSEVEERRQLYPIKLLERSLYFDTPCVSLVQYLRRKDKAGVIAEIKRQSPSKGLLNPYLSVEEVSVGYMQAGASALSILTDKEFFGGSIDDLRIARKFNFCPIVRKDFIVDEYQVIEAKSVGADTILLIASVLTQDVEQLLTATAHSLGLEVILEVRSEDEIESFKSSEADIIGVNSRDLRDFSVDIERARRLVGKLPSDKARIAESGITSPKIGRELLGIGYSGLLIGELFMSNPHPEKACASFIRDLQDTEAL
jgi:indole-3-glycerol phosphate synthase